MAALNCLIDAGEVSYSTSLITALLLTAPANQRLRVKSLSVYGKGVSPTDTPVKVRLYRTANAGTSSSTITPRALDESATETPQAVAATTFTVEPTGKTYLYTLEVHPQTGVILPLEDILSMAVLVKGGSRFGVEVTAAQATTLAIGLEYEE